MKKYFSLNPFFLFFSGWSFLALLLAWGGMFHAFAFFIFTILFVGVSLVSHFKKKRLSQFLSQEFVFSRILLWIHSRIHLPLLFLLSFFLASFLQPTTFFSGRDEGSLFQASFKLAETHSLVFSSPEIYSFFEIYEQGRALNFPGFYYTNNGSLVTQFPIAGIAWYASFLSLFGLVGLSLANAILLFLFFLSFIYIAKTFSPPSWLAYGIGMLATSFPIFWFSRFTLSENFALAFVWIFICATIMLLKKPTQKNFLLWFLSGTLLLFGRIEGVAFFFISLFIIFQNKSSRTFLFTNTRKYLFLPAGILFILSAISLSVSVPFYITVIKGFLMGSSETFHNGSAFLFSLIDRFRLIFLYGMGSTIIAGLFGIRLLLKKKGILLHHPLSLSFLIISPSFLYLLVSFISPDHPWMFRRLTFSVMPLFSLFSLFAFVSFFKTYKKTTALFAILLFLSQISAFLYFFPVIQGRDLLTFTQKLSQDIPDDELLLVDQLASGNGFQMLPGALSTIFSKHAVYFMNPYDLDRLNLSKFSSVSLLVPEGREDIYTPILREYNAVRISSFPLSVSALENSSISSRQFPELVTTQQNVILYRWKTSR